MATFVIAWYISLQALSNT